MSTYDPGVAQMQYWAAEAERDLALQQARPFMLLRPLMTKDGNQWCALYGENLHDGVAGFGDTPEKAAQAFDLAWLNERHEYVGER